MITLFKKATNKNIVEKVSPVTVEEIHETFYTEVDRLLDFAKRLNSLDTDKQDLIEKCERLKSLGFTSTTEIQEAETELERLKTLSQENESKKELTEAINYFSFKYPNYKFITEKSVKKICKKYNLVYAPVDRYIGSVPDKNLKHIEDFKIDKDDECFVSQTVLSEPLIGRRSITSLLSFKKYKENIKYEPDYKFVGFTNTFTTYNKCPLEIAAPLKDFNTTGMEVDDYELSKKIEILDPVVLKPVFFKGKKHYLIVTAWGVEASDDLVVNERFN